MPARVHRTTLDQDSDREEGSLPDTGQARLRVIGKLCGSAENEALRRNERLDQKIEKR